MINIGNRRNGDTGIYIGRGSPLGNPYHIGPDGDRATVIFKYRVWIAEKVLGKHDKQVCDALAAIAKHEEEHGTVTLVCWCAPKPCHGGEIRDMIHFLEDI